MTAVTTTHLVLDERGRAYVEGTRTRVAMIVMDKMNGLTPEQIHSSYPYLSITQIYAALAFYSDHQMEIDAEIKRERVEISLLRSSAAAPTRGELQDRMNRHEKKP